MSEEKTGKALHLSLSVEVHAMLATQAASDGISLTAYCTQALSRLARGTSRGGLTVDDIADVEWEIGFHAGWRSCIEAAESEEVAQCLN